jgi:WD40 repeat protein
MFRARAVIGVLSCLLICAPRSAASQPISAQHDVGPSDRAASFLIHLVQKLPLRTSPFNIIWSGDSRSIAAFSDWGNLITVWDRDGLIVHELHRPGAFFIGQGLGFLNGDRQMVTPTASFKTPNIMLSIFDVDSGKIVHEVAGPRPGENRGNEALVIAASPDQSTIATVTGGPPTGIQPVRLYSAPNWDVSAVLTGSAHEPATVAINLAFSADSKLLAVGRSDGSVVIYDLISKKVRNTINAFTKYLTPANCIAISADDQFVVVGTARAAEMWRYPDGNIAPLNQGRLTALRAPDPVRVYRISDGVLAESETGFLEPIYGISWSSKESLIAFIAGDDTLHLWDPTHPTDPGKVILLGKGATSVAFSPDGGQLAASDGNNVTLYQLNGTK